jgi:FixJ family two-component response regulator
MALTRLLKAAGYEVHCYKTTGEFLMKIEDTPNSCVLLDVRMPGPSGLELQSALKKRAPGLPIIFLTGHADISTCTQAMKAGAVDFLTKPVKREILTHAIKNALERGRQERGMIENRVRFEGLLRTLTSREREVFQGVVAGKMNKEIAADLGTAERTVKAHRAHLMEKMHATSIADLVHISDIIQFPPNRPN